MLGLLFETASTQTVSSGGGRQGGAGVSGEGVAVGSHHLSTQAGALGKGKDGLSYRRVSQIPSMCEVPHYRLSPSHFPDEDQPQVSKWLDLYSARAA